MGKDTRLHDKKEQKISTIQPTDERLTGRAGLALFEAYVRSIQILADYHQRGSDELANRALKNFGHEQLPFKRFAANAV
jgi:hypothetical protein